MIYTVTLNPSLDLFTELDNLVLGERNKIKSERTLPGGKAINVSRVLSALRIPTIATGFIGGFQGQFIKEWLQDEDITTDFVEMKGVNRTNIKIFENNRETMINFPGPKISSEEIDELLYYLSRVREGDTIIFGGSVPPMEENMDEDIYDRLLSVARGNKADFVADVPSQYLLSMVKEKPLLIKPNGEDIAKIFNVEINDKYDYIPYGKKLREMGAKNVIISYGAQGSMLFTEDKVYASNEIDDGREIINTVACRDSMIAGFLGNMVKDNDPVESYKLAIAAASATARVLDLPSYDQIVEMLNLVEIEEIE
jgi:hexose kinase, 1-phosphofructokinase family